MLPGLDEYWTRRLKSFQSVLASISPPDIQVLFHNPHVFLCVHPSLLFSKVCPTVFQNILQSIHLSVNIPTISYASVHSNVYFFAILVLSIIYPSMDEYEYFSVCSVAAHASILLSICSPCTPWFILKTPFIRLSFPPFINIFGCSSSIHPLIWPLFLMHSSFQPSI